MKICIICSIRIATPEHTERVEAHVRSLEAEGHVVRYPGRDTDQTGRGIDICRRNRDGVEWADVIHLFYDPMSQGTHFDMGMAYVARKPLIVIESVEYGEGKSFPRMAAEWEMEGAE